MKDHRSWYGFFRNEKLQNGIIQKLPFELAKYQGKPFENTFFSTIFRQIFPAWNRVRIISSSHHAFAVRVKNDQTFVSVTIKIVTFAWDRKRRTRRIELAEETGANKRLFGSYLAVVEEGQSEKDRKNGTFAGAVSGAIKRNSFDRLSRPNNWKRSLVPENRGKVLVS